MSIEQLKKDLKAVVGALPTGPLTSAADVAGFMKHNLLPLVESVVTEMDEMDDSIDDLVHQTPDVLHPEAAGLFLAIITSGRLLARELSTRLGPLPAGPDTESGRLKAAIKEWEELAAQGAELLEDITIPDPDSDVDPDAEDADTDAEPQEGEKA